MTKIKTFHDEIRVMYPDADDPVKIVIRRKSIGSSVDEHLSAFMDKVNTFQAKHQKTFDAVVKEMKDKPQDKYTEADVEAQKMNILFIKTLPNILATRIAHWDLEGEHGIIPITPEGLMTLDLQFLIDVNSKISELDTIKKNASKPM